MTNIANLEHWVERWDGHEWVFLDRFETLHAAHWYVLTAYEDGQQRLDDETILIHESHDPFGGET